MTDASNPVSVAILVLLSFISLILTGYLSMYCYSHYKLKEDKRLSLEDFSHWLDTERKPLIPGNFHTETIQPVSPHSDDEDSHDEVDLPFRDRDYSKMGRIIFVMRYNRKREELMVRLVQIEGIPATQDLYSPNSAYVDVQLKYTGNSDPGQSEEVQKPPRLDICLQEVYYFIISTQQMMSHALEFRINTFDDEFRRIIAGVVDVDLSEEMGHDLLNGTEIVFVKEILQPLLVKEEEDLVSNISEHAVEDVLEGDAKETVSRPSSRESSNMSWEPEELSLSTNSLFYRWTSEIDLGSNLLTEYKRSHSIGYLATKEWTVKEIPLDDQLNVTAADQIPPDNIISPIEFINLPIIASTVDPESFYHIVPDTPIIDISKSGMTDVSHRRVAYKKHSKQKQLARSLSRRSVSKFKILKPQQSFPLDRSSSWPSLLVPDIASSSDVTPEHKYPAQFFED